MIKEKWNFKMQTSQVIANVEVELLDDDNNSLAIPQRTLMENIKLTLG